MARSFHRTISDWARENDSDYASPEEKRARLRSLLGELNRKSHAKQMAREARVAQPPAPAMPRPVEGIPIEIVDSSPHLCFPASPDDLHAAARLLPPGVLDGLERIELRLGLERQLEESEPGEMKERDPWFGRPGWELVKGVFKPPLLGLCRMDSSSVIELYGIACERAFDPADPLAGLLRLRFLETFLHEIAHHDDRRRRVARGRWTMEDERKCERYAVVTSAMWMRNVVLPSMRTQDPSAIERIEAWIEAEVGVRLPLELFVGHWMWDDQGRARQASPLSVRSEFDELLESREEGTEQLEARLHFARGLTLGCFEEEALQVLAPIVRAHPDDARARLAAAQAHLDRHRPGEARAWATRAIELDPAIEGGWSCLGTALQREGDWPGAIDAYDRETRHAEEGNWKDRFDSIRGRIEIGRLEEARGLLPIPEAMTKGRRQPVLASSALQAFLALRCGEFAEACRLAEEASASRGIPNTLCVAVAIDATIRLGRPAKFMVHPEKLENLLRRLRFLGHGAWADRLEPLIATIPGSTGRGRKPR